MLSLTRKEGGVHVCDIHRGRSKPTPVYYYYDVDDKLLVKVDSYTGLLKTHFSDLKEKLRVSQETVNRALELLEKKQEVKQDEKAPVRRAYYFLKKKARELLREEIDLRRQI